MSNIGILRRDCADAVLRGDAALDRSLARRNAFEANLALQLERALGGDASLGDIENMTTALGEAYHRMTHAIDARTSLRLGLRRYFVLQGGWAPKTGDYRLDALDPFASKLLTRLPADVASEIEPRLKAVGAALGKTEISRRHPIDWRLRLNTPWLRLYVNFLSGKDRRAQSTRVSHNRRKPVDERFGLFVLLVLAGALSVLGAALIAGTVWALVDLLLTDAGRDALATLLGGSFAGLSSLLSGFPWRV